MLSVSETSPVEAGEGATCRGGSLTLNITVIKQSVILNVVKSLGQVAKGASPKAQNDMCIIVRTPFFGIATTRKGSRNDGYQTRLSGNYLRL